MAFDGVFTHYIVNELNEQLHYGRINKIYQISNYELIFLIRGHQQTHKLLCSIHPNYARCHITKENYPYPKEPPMFCMLLRKHLEGGRITKIEQKDNDRIVKFYIEHFNEMGDKDIKIFIVEVMGKHSNIILVNQKTNIIIDSLKHISPFLNSFRTLQPGATYIHPPTHDKVNFFLAKKEHFSNFLYDDTNLSKQLVQYFEGVSPLCAKELIFDTILNNEGLYQSYNDFIDRLEHHFNPSIIYTPKKTYFYLIPLKHIKGTIKTFSSLGDMLDRYYFNKDKEERIKQQTQDLEKYIKNELEKNKNKLNNLNTDLVLAKEALNYKVYGDLIIANSYHLKKGMTSLKATSYENNQEVTIELDPLKTPIENAKKYYHKYQKAKKAMGHLKKHMKLTKEEINYFEVLQEQIKSASLNDALEIRQELEEAHYLKRNISKKKKKKHKPQYEAYEIDGAIIYVGKNNLQNEYITHKLAHKTDYFMHVKDMPGAHVIIRYHEELTETIIRTAAQLAAYYSKGRLSSSVPVDYTLVKNIRKVPGSKFGFVTYDNQKTIYIDPDEDFIHALKNSKSYQ